MLALPFFSMNTEGCVLYTTYYVKEKAIVVVAAVLTAGRYFGSNAQWRFRKLLLFGMIRIE
jgi:hypothetical protein